jgi:hypothetical protein
MKRVVSFLSIIHCIPWAVPRRKELIFHCRNENCYRNTKDVQIWLSYSFCTLCYGKNDEWQIAIWQYRTTGNLVSWVYVVCYCFWPATTKAPNLTKMVQMLPALDSSLWHILTTFGLKWYLARRPLLILSNYHVLPLKQQNVSFIHNLAIENEMKYKCICI